MSAYAESRGWVGHLQPDPLMMRVRLQIGRQRFDGLQALTGIDGNGIVLSDPLPDNAEAPAIGIPDELARLLWELLNEHYGGPGPSRDLRADYVAERARVDKLIDAAISPPHIVYRTEHS